MRRLSFLAALSLTLAAGLAQGAARAADAQPSHPDFLVSGWDGANTIPEEWRFIFGPEHAPDQELLMERTGSNGFVAVECRSNGLERMTVQMVGVNGRVGDKLKAQVTVAGITSPLTFEVIANPSSHTEGRLVVNGAPVVGILGTMARVDPLLRAHLDIAINGRSLQVALPMPRDVPRLANSLCATWHNRSLGLTDPSALVDPYHGFSSGLHLPDGLPSPAGPTGP